MQKPLLSSLKPTDLPSPPQATLRIVHACADESISNRELTELVIADPILTAELLRVVNSSFFSVGRKISSINQAVNIIGHRALRNMALCIAVRDALNSADFNALDTDSYWEDSLLRAICARHIGEKFGFDLDECFTAGLLQDFGIMVLFYLNPDKCQHWQSLRQQTPTERYLAEKNLFGYSHDQVMQILGQAWQLPLELTEAISKHHQQYTGQHGLSDLCKTLYCADWLAAIFSSNDKNISMVKANENLQILFDVTAINLETFLSDVPEQVAQAATALGLHIKTNLDFEKVMREANAKLAKDNQSYQELTWKLENALKDRDRFAAELERELSLARDIQTSLLPKELDINFPMYGINISAKQLSGDFYDFMEVKNNKIYFNLADVSGKGMHAAMLMAKTSSLFRCLAKKIMDPALLMSIINDELCDKNINGMFVTMIAGIYDRNNDTVELINAGNPPALLVNKNGKNTEFGADTIPLGIIPDCDFPVRTFSLKNSALYLYTDGVSEGKLANGTELGIKGLLQLIHKVFNVDKKTQLNKIVSLLEKSKQTIHDDITLVIIQGNQSC
ncbi:MAG: hypothetical protein BMS9Abin31_1335 [Gammaproteobacteria bacterium]|nr:MAG: hypothetical protein BMS9Abin31_1335 [Gammaproteobacteria bacterium]